MEPEVSVKGLGYRYRGQQKPALDGVDLEVAEGEFVVVMGPSGAGKSTLCVSLNGLIPHFFRGRMEGEVRVGGRSTREGRVGEFAQEVGLVFQDFEASSSRRTWPSRSPSVLRTSPWSTTRWSGASRAC